MGGGVLDAKYERGRQTMEHTGRNPMSTDNTYTPRFKIASALQHPMGCLERIEAPRAIKLILIETPKIEPDKRVSEYLVISRSFADASRCGDAGRPRPCESAHLSINAACINVPPPQTCVPGQGMSVGTARHLTHFFGFDQPIKKVKKTVFTGWLRVLPRQ